MHDPHAFLVARVLHDRQPVTYRLLSRTFGMHVDEARRYVRGARAAHASTLEQWQHAQDAASVHATYLLRGTRKDTRDGVPVDSIELVLHDKLDAYASCTCQMYAVQAHASYDAPLLAAVNRQLIHDADMVARWADDATSLGVLPNRHTRTGEAPAAVPRAAPSKPQPQPQHTPAEPRLSDPTPADTKRVPSDALSSASGRKKRRVVHKVRTKNEKGYTVTRDVETYESCSDEERGPAPTPAPAPPPAPAPKRPAKAKPQQPSLTSFFTKR